MANAMKQSHWMWIAAALGAALVILSLVGANQCLSDSSQPTPAAVGAAATVHAVKPATVVPDAVVARADIKGGYVAAENVPSGFLPVVYVQAPANTPASVEKAPEPKPVVCPPPPKPVTPPKPKPLGGVPSELQKVNISTELPPDLQANVRDVMIINAGQGGGYGGLAICGGTQKFMFDMVKRAKGPGSVCEVGMGTGVSTLLMAAGSVEWKPHVHSFDLGSDIQAKVAGYLRGVFGPRVTLHQGDFKATFAKAAQEGISCDFMFLDAIHPSDMLYALKTVTHKDTVWFYHTGGSRDTVGGMHMRPYIMQHFKGLMKWDEAEEGPRTDGKRCAYWATVFTSMPQAP